MRLLLHLLILAEALTQGCAYTRCSYSHYDGMLHQTITSYYRCSTSQYCCGNHSCCTSLYSRWYLWFLISTFFFVMFLIWWYYRYRYRPRHAQAIPARVTTVTAYPCSGPITMINPKAGTVHYTAYSPYPGAVPITNYPMQAPPPYSAVVGNRYP